MARNGLILNHNEATGSRKVFRYLWGLWDTIKKSNLIAKVQKCRNTVNYRILLYIYIYIYICTAPYAIIGGVRLIGGLEYLLPGATYLLTGAKCFCTRYQNLALGTKYLVPSPKYQGG